MLDNAIVEKLETHWYEGWNNGDIDIIMAPFGENVAFDSPSVPRLTGQPGRTTLEGLEAVRAYMADTLQRIVGVRYTHDATYVGTDGIVIVWTAHSPDGSTIGGADTMRVGPDAKVFDWRSFYADDLATR
jgi:hypothetical protein